MSRLYRQKFKFPNKQPRECQVLVDYHEEKVYIHAPMTMTMIKEFPLDEYTEFEGNMEAFAKSKLFPEE